MEDRETMNVFTLKRIIREELDEIAIIGNTSLDIKDTGYITDALVSAIQKKKLVRVKKFLFVEDGSVDLDELGNLGITNPEIKVLVVRQGGRIPELIDTSNMEK